MKNISIILLFGIISAAATGQTGGASADVRGVIKAFEAALEERNLDRIGGLVSADIVVFENGYRNDGWPDFRDHHLIPEFKQATSQYTSSIVKLDVSANIGLGVFKNGSQARKEQPSATRFLGDLRSAPRIGRMENCRPQLECEARQRMTFLTAGRKHLRLVPEASDHLSLLTGQDTLIVCYHDD